MEIVQPEASVVQTGIGIRYVADWAYAYSGVVSVTNVEASMLNFTTGSGVIVATVQFNMASTGSDQFQYRVKFNDTVVQTYVVLEPQDRAKPDYNFNLIIPPQTLFVATAQNISDASDHDQVVTMTGRVYGVE